MGEKLRAQILSEIIQEDEQIKFTGAQKLNKKEKKSILDILGFPEYLSYGQRVIIREECTRFLRLSYLLDFLTLNSLVNIYYNSANEFLEIVKKIDVQTLNGNIINNESFIKQDHETAF